MREMAKARTAKKVQAQVQAPKAEAPKAEAKVKREALAILKASDEKTLAVITKALNGAFDVSEPKSGGTFYRVRLFAK